jgi:hypothetical protein
VAASAFTFFPREIFQTGLTLMKNEAAEKLETEAVENFLLETVVSAHYLAMQMRMLVVARDFPGAAETGLMADSLSRWAQRVAGWSPAGERESSPDRTWRANAAPDR